MYVSDQFEDALTKFDNILISRLRFMGDIILTTPLLSALKRAFPSSEITYLAEAPYAELLQNHPDVDEIISFERGNSTQNLSVFKKLLSTKFDLAIDLFGNPRSALLTWLSGAKMRIGGDFRGRRHFYTHRIGDDGLPKTAVDFHLRYLLPLGIDVAVDDPCIFVTPREEEWARSYLQKKGFDPDQEIIGIHPGATWPAKRWFPERFAQLANELAARQLQIIFTMAPGEEALLHSVIDQCTFSPILPDALSLRKLAAVLKIIDVYVSNDCGPMHLAPAVGTPTVGIFGPGEPDIWFPYKREKGHRLVYKEIDCSHCHRDFCEKMDCMRAITVDDVLAQVMDTL